MKRQRREAQSAVIHTTFETIGDRFGRLAKFSRVAHPLPNRAQRRAIGIRFPLDKVIGHAHELAELRRKAEEEEQAE